MSTSICLSISTDAIPAGLSEDLALRSIVRSGLEIARRNGLRPNLAGTPASGRRTVKTRLEKEEAEYLRLLLREQSSSTPVTAAAARLAEAGMAVLCASQSAAPPTPRTDALARCLDSLGHDPTGRAEQRALFDYIDAALRSPSGAPIVAAQASTGIGKTAIAQAVASMWSSPANGRWSGATVVAFPTLNGVKAFGEQWHRSRAVDSQLSPLAMLFGRAEFVSAGSLDELLAHPAALAPHLAAASLARIDRWRQEQDLIPAGALVRPWIMDALLQVEERLDRAALCVSVSTPPDDAGANSYHQQFAGAASARVIACSHAMLAIDVLLRAQALGKDAQFRDARAALRDSFFSAPAAAERASRRTAGVKAATLSEELGWLTVDFERAAARDSLVSSRRLPAYDYLIVDESHQLEQAFSNAFSSTVSLRETLRTMHRLTDRPCPGARASLLRACSAATKAVDELTHMSADGEEVDLHSTDDKATRLRVALQEAFRAIDSVRFPKDGTDIDRGLWSSLARDRDTLRLALSDRAGQKSVSFTPVRRYPHLTVGSGDVSTPLATLWAGAKAALLLSATLYLRRGQGWSSKYQCSLLSVPSDRLVEVPVVQAAWLQHPIQALFIPEARQRTVGTGLWLRPPSRRDALSQRAHTAATNQWLFEAAQALEWIYRTAAGGVMCACTSHGMVAHLGALLRANLRDSSPMCVSTELPSLGALKSIALERAREGKRPLVIGTGGLWTGFDLSGSDLDIPSAEDSTITDLVIPRLPFGMNRTLTHKRRVADPKDSRPHEMLSAALLLQQGIGRLVRSEGLPRNRRIFLLDARLVDPAFDTFLSSCKRVYEGYPVATFKASDIESVDG